MKYSVIILNYNVKYFVDACLQSVQKAIAGKDAEIIVADNNSTDGSKAYFKDQYPAVKFLWFDENSGFAKAYNRAVKQAQGEYLLILNPDTLVSENLLDEFQKLADRHPDFGIIGGKMIDGTGHFLPESKRGIPTPIVAFSKLTKLYKILNFKPFNQYYAGHLSENESGEVPVLTGALMFMRKKTYEQAGGFDERYFMYGEDIDLSYTIWKTGQKNYYLPSAKIIHFKGESSQQDANYLNNFLNTTFQFYRKHFYSFPVLEWAMKQFFKLWLKLRIKKNQNNTSNKKLHAYYFIGKKQHFETIKNYYKELKKISNTSSSFPENSLVIFDTSHLSFTEIIETMENNRNKKNTYRFYFPPKQMLLGSDKKDQLGKVKFINDLS